MPSGVRAQPRALGKLHNALRLPRRHLSSSLSEHPPGVAPQAACPPFSVPPLHRHSGAAWPCATDPQTGRPAGGALGWALPDCAGAQPSPSPGADRPRWMSTPWNPQLRPAAAVAGPRSWRRCCGEAWDFTTPGSLRARGSSLSARSAWAPSRVSRARGQNPEPKDAAMKPQARHARMQRLKPCSATIGTADPNCSLLPRGRSDSGRCAAWGLGCTILQAQPSGCTPVLFGLLAWWDGGLTPCQPFGARQQGMGRHLPPTQAV